MLVVIGEDALETVAVRFDIDDFHAQESPCTYKNDYSLFLIVPLYEPFNEFSNFPRSTGIHLVAEGDKPVPFFFIETDY